MGIRCLIVLMVADDDSSDDPVLQPKQASPSALAAVSTSSPYADHGRWVVVGGWVVGASRSGLCCGVGHPC